MTDLPLFPLNAVIFPGMPITLHIFEQRYRKMVQRCIGESEPFGVVLIKRGSEALGSLAEPHLIGCSARIIQVEHLASGRMNIVAVGEQRFSIQSLNRELEYLLAEVEYQPQYIEDRQVINQAGERLRPLVNRYMQILEEAELLDGEMTTLPYNSLDLTNLAAFLLQIPTHQKQSLLAADNAAQFIYNTLRVYRREVALMKSLLAVDKVSDGSAVFLN